MTAGTGANSAGSTTPGRRFWLAYEGVTYAVVVLGFLSLWLSQVAGTFSLLLMAGTLWGSWGERRWPAFSELVWRLLALGVLVGLGVLWATGRRSPLSVACDLLLFLQVQRLFVRRESRDYAWIYLLAFLQVLLGCVLTVVPGFAFVLVGFLVAITWAMLLFQVKQGMDQEIPAPGAPPTPGGGDWRTRLRVFVFGEPTPPPPPASLTRYNRGAAVLSGPFVAATTAVTLLMLLGTFAIFLAAPRLNLSFFRPNKGPRTHVAGFTDEVRLGEVGQILAGRGKVMRVKLSGPAVDRGDEIALYWRGTALDYFDGVRWQLSRDQRQMLHEQGGFLNPRTPPRANVVQEITLEPLDTDILFALHRPLAFEMEAPSIQRSITGGYQLDRPERRLSYRVWSQVEEPAASGLRRSDAPIPEAVLDIYLQLPDNLSPEVRTLGADIVRDAPTVYDAARAVEAHLRARYTYTLVPESTGDRPMEDFLFRTRAGHCEYFATSMAVLLRTQGIPARIVNGFSGGTWNEIGGYWVVTQSDAHTWVEVFFPQEGWVRFDPTPSDPSGAAAEDQGTLAMYVDYLESLWYFYVLDYGLEVQVAFVQDLVKAWGIAPAMWGGADPVQPDQPAAPALDKGALRWMATVLAGGILALLAARLWRGRGPSTRPEDTLRGPPRQVRAYLQARRRLERRLGKLGLERGESETPLERARRAGGRLGPQAEALAAVEAAYYAHRFGGRPVGVAAVRQVEALVGALSE